MNRDICIAVLGLGYVGLPLAVEFSKHYDVFGFDINECRVHELRAGRDSTLEVPVDELQKAERLEVSCEEEVLAHANVYIVTTPTPINEYKEPDLGPLLAASTSIGNFLKAGDTVIYESTVYPGATEEQCVRVLEAISGLKFNEHFSVGYSPERINPGDKKHRLPDIRKVTSGSNPEAAEFVDSLYKSIITAGTHLAPSIRVAEAAKVIENIQRDVNIALVNELARLFDELGIDTQDVLDAAGTKWNFLPFTPGLVGGHCIGVDPYYLTYKARSIGFHPEIVLAGRRINDSMGIHVAAQLVKLLSQRAVPINGARILILGLTFKENTPDLRNTRVIDIINELKEFGVDVDVFDPWASPTEARNYLGVELLEGLNHNNYDGVVFAVAHDDFLKDDKTWVRELLRTDDGVVYDLKSKLPRDLVDHRL